MKIGIPKERKVREGRIALVPAACAELVRDGHVVRVERSAGVLSGFSDEQYLAAGVRLMEPGRAVYDESELIVKVKEPVNEELDYLRSDHLLFSFLHLAANAELALRLKAIRLEAIAFETVEQDGQLPLLSPMSQIAGRVAAQVGTTLLHQSQGGRGVLLGGVASTARGRVVVLGAGTAGLHATELLARIGANVTVFDKNISRLDKIRQLGDNITTFYPYTDAIVEAISNADLVIGAVLIPGARAPILVSREDVARMPENSVIVDISVDQGGCFATTRPMSYAEPAYRECGVLHFTVTNMPGAVPRTATQALSAALLPYVRDLAGRDWRSIPALRLGLNLSQGEYVHPEVKAALDKKL